MDFEVSVRQSGSTTIFDLRGPVMYTEARALHDMVCELLKIGHKKILVNLSNVTRLDTPTAVHRDHAAHLYDNSHHRRLTCFIFLSVR